MAVVKLPSGRTVKIPDGMTENQAIEYIFDKLEGNEDYAEDRQRLGDRLETSGWGSTIGGAIGGTLGAIGGTFVAPVAGTVAGGAAGGAAGSAIGEGIEQWLSGKGDWEDVGTSALYGGALGGIGGGAAGAAARFGAAGAATLGGAAGAVEGARDGGGLTGGLLGAAGGAATGGVGGSAFRKGLSLATEKLGLNKPVKEGVQIGKDAAAGYAQAQWLAITGRKTAGNLTQATARWQLARDLTNKIYNEGKKVILKGKRRRKLTVAEENDLRRASKLEADDLVKQKQAEYKADIREAHKKYATPETQQEGGGYATGGEVRGRRGDRARNRRPQRSRENQLASAAGILGGFVPGVGEAMDAKDAYACLLYTSDAADE